MRNFVWGILLGVATGVAVLYYGGIPHYLPGLMALLLLIGVLMTIEKIETRVNELTRINRELRDVRDMVNTVVREVREVKGMVANLEAVEEAAPSQATSQAPGQDGGEEESFALRDAGEVIAEESHAFIPQIQVDAASGTRPAVQKQTLENRSIEDVARKLASIQDGTA
ncbi:MAG: hypothetical protein HQL58_09790 [Magnetococcales bacterium]|nr:hypothetical protein [Magnetococcales bacterium]